jgi:lipopolysaccharide transport system ATP-binding protein
MSSAIAIKVSNLSKKYQLKHPVMDVSGNPTREHWALKDVSFEIKKGEAIGIIGPNGSGKSTLLKILSGITKPTSGFVEMTGRVASILDIGAGFHQELSGRENVFLNGQLLGFTSKEIKAQYNKIVEFSGIGAFIEEPVKNYSNGMYLRLAFSILAHLDFDIYLFDEVMSVGDASFIFKTKAKIKELTNKKKTIILVSHNILEMTFFDKVIEINNGTILNNGLEKDTLSKYILKSIDNSEISVNTKFVNRTDFTNLNFSKEIKLISVSLFQNDSNEIPFRTDKAFYLEVNYEKVSSIETADLILTISDINGSLILVSSPIFKGKVNTKKESGRYKVICEIPENIFSSNVYSLGLSFVKNTFVFKKIESDIPLNIEISDKLIQQYGVITTFTNLFYFRANVILRNFSEISNLNIPAGMLLPHFEWKIDSES